MPAITPWEGGEPQFALTDYGRSAECARQRLCSVCGTLMPKGVVWRVVGAAESSAIREALDAGRPYRNMAATLEGPGHRACMLYASMVCPYLARPNARRGLTAKPDDMTAHVVRGAVRGDMGAVVGFGSTSSPSPGARSCSVFSMWSSICRTTRPTSICRSCGPNSPAVVSRGRRAGRCGWRP
ncbi:hypothetical protein ACRAWF_20385 [Streptomyces sp. L7]